VLVCIESFPESWLAQKNPAAPVAEAAGLRCLAPAAAAAAAAAMPEVDEEEAVEVEAPAAGFRLPSLGLLPIPLSTAEVKSERKEEMIRKRKKTKIRSYY
jgi:hypothetical protein